MAKVSKYSNWSKVLYSKATLLILAIIVAIFAYNLIGLVIKSRETAQRRAEAEAEAIAMQNRHDKLSASIAMLETDEGKEQALRDKFGVVKDGEKAVVFIESNEPEPKTEAAEEGNFFQRLWHRIFGKNNPTTE